MPAACATALTACAWSPESMTVCTPSWCSACTAAAASGLMASATAYSASGVRVSPLPLPLPSPSARASRLTLRPSAWCACSAACHSGADSGADSEAGARPAARGLIRHRRWPCTVARTPRPGTSCASGKSTLAAKPCAARPLAMARATGWSLCAANACARACRAASSASSDSGWDAASAGWPRVSVPVLSKATVRSWRACSRYTPPLMSTPSCAARASALTTVAGVAITSAQGQAMTSSTSAL